MKNEEILRQVMQTLANEGNEKAKMAMGLVERPDNINVDSVFKELTEALDKLNKASEHVNSQYLTSAIAMHDKIRMHIHAATVALGKL